MLQYQEINESIIGLANLLLKDGVPRKTRGLQCFELPYPIVIKLIDPTSRIVTIKNRKWNPYLPFAESLWLASGRNSIEMVSHYLKKLSDFSDDGRFMRAGYGPILRKYNNSTCDYKVAYEHTIIQTKYQ